MPATAGGAQLAKFRELDKNGDGLLTPDEVSSDPILSTDFAKYDNSADGRLSPNEFERYKMQVARNKSSTDQNKPH